MRVKYHARRRARRGITGIVPVYQCNDRVSDRSVAQKATMSRTLHGVRSVVADGAGRWACGWGAVHAAFALASWRGAAWAGRP